MRSVLVPLDGSDFAAAILPDARRLAGRDGQLILMRDVPALREGWQWKAEAAQVYLNAVAQVLRTEGVEVRTQPLTMADAAEAIDEGAELLGADMIAAATHARTPEERWQSGSVAWRALLRSPVPVLVRHIDPDNPFVRTPESEHPRLMVPLDGSALAETALPLAQELADEWSASIWLVRVVLAAAADVPHCGDCEDAATAHTYLERVARTLHGEVHVHALLGLPEELLVRAVSELDISTVVMTTHGCTGVSRTIPGTVADRLIHDLRCPIVVVPLLAAMSAMEARDASQRTADHAPVSPAAEVHA